MMRGLFFASFISIMLAMLVSFLPTVEGDSTATSSFEKGKEQPVFSTVKPVILQRTEMVPFLQHIPINYSYKRVEVEHQDVFIDLEVKRGEVNKKYIYQDAYTLISTFLKQTTNMNRIFIRFIVTEGSQPALLLAVTTDRNDELLKALYLKHVTTDHPAFLEKHTKLDYGTGWSED
jgi:hypothetical protein